MAGPTSRVSESVGVGLGPRSAFITSSKNAGVARLKTILKLLEWKLEWSQAGPKEGP